MTTLPFTVAHIEGLRPRMLSAPPSPITFSTLGGCASDSKGARVVVGALQALRDAGLEGAFRFRVLGGIEGWVRRELAGYGGIDLHDVYGREQLDSLLDGVDVGIMPSLWEEAFGYAGLELLAKGIPLIANPLGGIVEYAHEGETAWLNRSCSADGLAELMAALIADPGRVLEMHRSVLAQRERLVRPFAEHVAAIEAIYREVDSADPLEGAPAAQPA
jgi:glycosyltransferase involved in cell wall biosynthesis